MYSKIPSGLPNKGATCFANSFIQLFMCMEEFIKFILLENNIENIKYFIKCYYIKNNIEKSITDFLKYIGIKSMSSQEDAHEFFIKFIDNIRGKMIDKENDINQLLCILVKNNTFRSDTKIETNYKTNNILLNESSFVKHESIISIELKKNGSEYKFYDSYISYTSYEVLKKDERTINNTGTKKWAYARQLTILSAPKYFIISLKRFIYDVFGKISQKIDDKITDIPINNFNIFPLANKSEYKYYNLKGFINHSGGTGGGHYFAFVRKQNNWYLCNDSNVSAVSIGHIPHALMQSYILLYERIDDNLNIGAGTGLPSAPPIASPSASGTGPSTGSPSASPSASTSASPSRSGTGPPSVSNSASTSRSGTGPHSASPSVSPITPPSVSPITPPSVSPIELSLNKTTIPQILPSSPNVSKKSLNMLTYNVSWGCMTENPLNRTAVAIATKCATLGNNTCAKNIAQVINDNVKTGYNFIFLQEASNLDILIKNSSVLKTMTHIDNSINVLDKSGKTIGSSVVSLFYSNDYQLIHSINGNINDNYDPRPIIIAFFKNNKTNENLIVINFHNAHSLFKDALEQRISDIFKNLKLNKTISNIESNNWTVIVGGDFNDHGGYNYWKKFTPFKYCTTFKFKDISVLLKKMPPHSCCIGKSSIRTDKNKDPFYGDYILFSENIHNKYNIDLAVPEKFNYDANKFPTSDHLPVQALCSEK